MSLTQQSGAATLPPDVGECSACGKRNSHRATRCHACQETLPWAIGKVKAAPAKANPAQATKANAAAAKPSAAPAPRPAPSHNNDDDDAFVWWQSIGWGALCLAIAGVSFWALAAKEAAHESFRARWWIVLLYSLGGKWLVAGLFIVLGLIGIAVGIMQYFEEK